MHPARFWVAILAILSACDLKDVGGNRGPLPTIEEGDPGERVGPSFARPRADRESVLGANAEVKEGTAHACAALIDPYASPPVPVRQLVAGIHGTAAHPEIHGEIRLVSTGDGVDVQSKVTGLPAGAHAHRVHLFGDCTDPAITAGPPFDFERALVADPDLARIAGDLGILSTSGAREATSERDIPDLELTGGPDSLLGRAVVVHAGPAHPDGAAGEPLAGAGEPLACGVLGIVGSGVHSDPRVLSEPP